MTDKRTVTVPYLGPTGRPFHALSDSQRRGYTRGLLNEQDSLELQQHCSDIAARVTNLQARRLEIRKKVRDMLTFRQDTPEEERARRLKEVERLKREYVAAGRDIEGLKASEFTITEGEPLSLPPIE